MGDDSPQSGPGQPPRPGFRGSVDHALRPQGKVFYGWWMVASGAAAQAVIGVLFNQAFSTYAAVLRNEFGWSRSELSAAFAMARVESGLLGPVEGWLLDRFGPRKVMLLGIALLGAGLIAFSFIQTLLMFYLVYFVMAIGATLGGFLAITVALVSWFNRHRAKALAITQIGFATGGLLLPITVASIEQFGWRPTAFASGLIIWALGLPLATRMRHRPELTGDTPDGLPVVAANTAGGGGHHSRHAVAMDGSEDFTARQALRTSGFWFISLGHASALLVVSAVMVHVVLHLNEGLGYSLGEASRVIAVMTGMQIVGQISGGILGDRFDKRIIATICMVAHCVALLLLAFATNLAMVIAFAMLHGWAWGTRGPLMQAMRADYFGTTNFGKIMGLSTMIVTMGNTTGPLVAGIVADRTGNYKVGFTILAVGALLGSVFFLAAKKPTPPARPVVASADSAVA